MKDSKEKEHRISNLKDMINNIKEEENEDGFDAIEEDNELIDYLNENNENNNEYEELEIDDEFIYRPKDDNIYAVNLEETPIDEEFIINTPKVIEDPSEDEVINGEEIEEEVTGEISESFDNILNAKIGRTPIKGLISTILGLILIVLAAITIQSRSDKVIDNVISGETAFIFVILLIFGLVFLIYGLYKVFGFKNPLSKVSTAIDTVESDDEENVPMDEKDKDDNNVVPKSNIPLDRESYKIGEYDFNDLKNNLKKPKTISEPKKTTPTEKEIDDIAPFLEKPNERTGAPRDEIDEIEYNKSSLDNESIDDIFAEVEDIEDIPKFSTDPHEKEKK